jgi:hypothetical protein
MLMSAPVFYFANKSCSKFKFEFESKEFKFLKDLNNGKAIFYLPLAMGQNPGRGPASRRRSPGSPPGAPRLTAGI